MNNCDVNPTAGAELWTVRTPEPKEARKVLVVGGGPAGMQAAITAAERGHRVVLAEATDSLGGALKFSFNDDHKTDLAGFASWLRYQVFKHAVDVRLDTAVDAYFIEKEKPYAVICAVGAEPIRPSFPGLDALPRFFATDVYLNPEAVQGNEPVIVGGGLVGCEVGIFLASRGKNVTILEMGPEFAPDANIIHRDSMNEAIREVGDRLRILTGRKCEAITAAGVKVRGVDGTEDVVGADCVICAMGFTPKYESVLALQRAKGVTKFFAAGDCRVSSRVKNAIHGGYYAAMDIV
jgi:NADPH-dependent 2,4-dienoyl-CoA reductase/sulfur reductase-like enzyme